MFKNRKNLFKLAITVSFMGVAGFEVSTFAMEQGSVLNVAPTYVYDIQLPKEITGRYRQFQVMKQRAVDLSPFTARKIKNGDVEAKKSLIATFENIILKYYCDDTWLVGNSVKFENIDAQAKKQIEDVLSNQKKEIASRLLRLGKKFEDKDLEVKMEKAPTTYTIGSYSNLNHTFDNFISKLSSENEDLSSIYFDAKRVLDYLVNKYVHDVDSFTKVDKEGFLSSRGRENAFALGFLEESNVGLLNKATYRLCFSPQWFMEKMRNCGVILNNPESFNKLCFKIEEVKKPEDKKTEKKFIIIVPKRISYDYDVAKNYNSAKKDNGEEYEKFTFDADRDFLKVASGVAVLEKEKEKIGDKFKSSGFHMVDGGEYKVTVYDRRDIVEGDKTVKLGKELYSENVIAKKLCIGDWSGADNIFKYKIKHSKNFDVVFWFEQYLKDFDFLKSKYRI